MLDGLRGGSPASYAIRFAAGFPGMLMVLSGTSSLSQMEDNIAFMRDFRPLDERELAAVKRVQEIFHSKNLIPCTVCRDCTDGCPMQIAIPKYFSLYNADMQERRGRGITPDEGWTPQGEYYENVAKHFGKASACIQCGQCEGVCPQHLPIIEYLQTVAKHFERE